MEVLIVTMHLLFIVVTLSVDITFVISLLYINIYIPYWLSTLDQIKTFDLIENRKLFCKN